MSEDIKEKRKIIARKVLPVIDHRLVSIKLAVHDWMKEMSYELVSPFLVEVQFKNTRKGIFTNPDKLPVKIGDVVAVEAAQGHDIGVVSLTGELVKEQVRLKRIDLTRNPPRRLYRRAKPNDIDKWREAILLEHATMIKAREIAVGLALAMKIGDVEYQGDKTKAIFYYIAEERVDFRQLIKIFAETFRVRVEMKQIGARQEAGRLGGIGACGRELCCCSFMTNFVSVSTSAARYQDVSLNPQKLAGQCGKLKCCLNFELAAYVDGHKDFPARGTWLNTGEGMLYYQKSDIFGRTVSYSLDKEGRGDIIRLTVERAREIIAMNRRGQIPPKAIDRKHEPPPDIKYTDGVGEGSISRFDEKKPERRGKNNRNRKKQPRLQAGTPTNRPPTASKNPADYQNRRHEHPRPDNPSPRPDNPDK